MSLARPMLLVLMMSMRRLADVMDWRFFASSYMHAASNSFWILSLITQAWIIPGSWNILIIMCRLIRVGWKRLKANFSRSRLLHIPEPLSLTDVILISQA